MNRAVLISSCVVFLGAMTRSDWSHEINACNKGKNNLIIDRISIDDCKANCKAQGGFLCRSVEYHYRSRRCVLSEATSSSSSFRQLCHDSGWTYTELIDWSPGINGCIKENNNLVLDRISMDDCKAQCKVQTGFVCRSLEYHSRSGRCVLSEATRFSTSYRQPCPASGWTYTELIDAPPASSAYIPPFVPCDPGFVFNNYDESCVHQWNSETQVLDQWDV